jgi:hypothetical protein
MRAAARFLCEHMAAENGGARWRGAIWQIYLRCAVGRCQDERLRVRSRNSRLHSAPNIDAAGFAALAAFGVLRPREEGRWLAADAKLLAKLSLLS